MTFWPSYEAKSLGVVEHASIGRAVVGGFEFAGEGQRMFDDEAFDGIADRE